jgi:hypothetical protein
MNEVLNVLTNNKLEDTRRTTDELEMTTINDKRKSMTNDYFAKYVTSPKVNTVKVKNFVGKFKFCCFEINTEYFQCYSILGLGFSKKSDTGFGISWNYKSRTDYRIGFMGFFTVFFTVKNYEKRIFSGIFIEIEQNRIGFIQFFDPEPSFTVYYYLL